MQDGKRDFEKNCVENEKLKIDFYKGIQVIFPEKVGKEFDIEKQYSKWWYLGGSNIDSYKQCEIHNYFSRELK